MINLRRDGGAERHESEWNGSPTAPTFVLVSVVLVLLTRPFDASLSGIAEQWVNAVLVVLLVGSVAGLSRELLKSIRTVLSRDRVLVLLVVWAFASVFWSTEPLTSLQRSLAVGGATALGVLVGTRFRLENQIQLFVVALLGAGVLSIAMAVAVPAIGRSAEWDGAWIGIYKHKNELGRYMALLTLGSLFLLLHRRVMIGTCGVLIGVGALFATTSKTPLVVLLVCLLLLPIIWIRGQRLTLVFSATLLSVACGLAVLLWLSVAWQEAVERIGKDPTLTGRTLLWLTLAPLALDRLLLGYGYGGFWLGAAGPSREVWRVHGWGPNHAHNGFLDVILDVGLVALLLLTFHILRMLHRSVRLLDHNRTSLALWPLATGVFLILLNVTYSMLFTQNLFYWVLYCSIAFAAVTTGDRGTLQTNAAAGQATSRA